jgi:hypothetical protein
MCVAVSTSFDYAANILSLKNQTVSFWNNKRVVNELGAWQKSVVYLRTTNREVDFNIRKKNCI